MLVSELIEFLHKCPQDIEVLTRTNIGTYIRPPSYGLVRIIPVIPGSKYDKRPINRRISPGNEWREPVNTNDESEVDREYCFTIG